MAQIKQFESFIKSKYFSARKIFLLITTVKTSIRVNTRIKVFIFLLFANKILYNSNFYKKFQIHFNNKTESDMRKKWD